MSRVKSRLIALIRQAASNWVGLLCAAAAVLIVCGWRGLVLLNRPAHLQEMAMELGSVVEFTGDPSPNHAGTKLVFRQATRTGIGVFFQDFATANRVLVYEQPEKNYSWRDFQLWGWSPDDRHFAFSRRADPEASREIVVCNGQTGEIEGSVAVPRSASAITWLSPQALAYADDNKELYRIEQLSAKKWGASQAFKKQVGKPKKLTKEEREAIPPVIGLAAISPDTIVWQQGQVVWQWTFGASEPEKLWEATDKQLLDVALDERKRHIWLHFKEDGSESFGSYNLAFKKFTDLGSVPVPNTTTYRVVWFTGGGHAYVPKGIYSGLMVRESQQAAPVGVSFNDQIATYVSSGNALFITGSQRGEPVGIWKYDVGTSNLSCVVSNRQEAFKYAKIIEPERHVLTNAEGAVLKYIVWKPPSTFRGKRPLVIGQANYNWQGYQQAAANGGAYFVCVERRWRLQFWSEDVMAVYAQIQHMLNIDTGNVYLYGTSAETPHVNELLETKPELWKGAVLFNPASFPDASKIGVSKLLLDCGGDDKIADRVKEFQNRAAEAGISVSVVLQENAQHVYRSLESKQGRESAFVAFLFGH